jgi:hypothetical protein
MLRPLRCVGLGSLRCPVDLPLKLVLNKHSETELLPNELILGHCCNIVATVYSRSSEHLHS